ncbi:hypothetical protein ACF1FX_35395 [Streptomyces sp. NPDC014646]|uniref:hypothetical protein n=1 Tax=unclassified Streptomyces TaxID=2593676 RepID=UPI0036F917FA
MSDVGLSLGPLERVNDRWVVGDSRRPGGTWLEFRSGGLYQHEPNSEGKLIPWQRITLVTQFTLGAKYPKYSYSPMALLGGLPGPWKGRGPGYLHMTLRHPYENEVVRFDRHPHWYNPTELVLSKRCSHRPPTRVRHTGSVTPTGWTVRSNSWYGSGPRRPAG